MSKGQECHGVMQALAEPSCCPCAQALIFKPAQKMEAGHNRALYSIIAGIPSLQPIDPLCWWRL